MKPTVRQLKRQAAIVQSMLRTAQTNRDTEATGRLVLVAHIISREASVQEEKESIAQKLMLRYKKVA